MNKFKKFEVIEKIWLRPDIKIVAHYQSIVRSILRAVEECRTEQYINPEGITVRTNPEIRINVSFDGMEYIINTNMGKLVLKRVFDNKDLSDLHEMVFGLAKICAENDTPIITCSEPETPMGRSEEYRILETYMKAVWYMSVFKLLTDRYSSIESGYVSGLLSKQAKEGQKFSMGSDAGYILPLGEEFEPVSVFIDSSIIEEDFEGHEIRLHICKHETNEKKEVKSFKIFCEKDMPDFIQLIKEIYSLKPSVPVI